MIISDFRADDLPNSRLISAQVSWEETPLGMHTLEFEFLEPGRPIEISFAEPFLVSCFPLAAIHGEQRVKLTGSVCPMLADNLETAFAAWKAWGGVSNGCPRVEAQRRPAPKSDHGRQRSLGLVSGGVDSLHMLLKNRRLYRHGDPAFLGEAIFVHGFDIGKRAHNLEQPRYDAAFRQLGFATADLGIHLVGCRSNLRQLPSPAGFWTHRHYGAALAAVGHAAAIGRAFLFIAATNDIAHLSPVGSHPLVDQYFSSQRVTVVHDGSRYSRLEKLSDLLAWGPGLAALRVCPAATGTALNCGRCEKCLRTRLELLVLGVAESAAFGPSLMPVEAWDDPSVRITVTVQAVGYRNLLPHLRRLGHDAICRAIEAKLADYEERTAGRSEWGAG